MLRKKKHTLQIYCVLSKAHLVLFSLNIWYNILDVSVNFIIDPKYIVYLLVISLRIIKIVV